MNALVARVPRAGARRRPDEPRKTARRRRTICAVELFGAPATRLRAAAARRSRRPRRRRSRCADGGGEPLDGDLEKTRVTRRRQEAAARRRPRARPLADGRCRRRPRHRAPRQNAYAAECAHPVSECCAMPRSAGTGACSPLHAQGLLLTLRHPSSAAATASTMRRSSFGNVVGSPSSSFALREGGDARRDARRDEGDGGARRDRPGRRRRLKVEPSREPAAGAAACAEAAAAAARIPTQGLPCSERPGAQLLRGSRLKQ